MLITGFINLEFEGDTLYPKKSDYKNHHYNRSLYLFINNEKYYSLKKKVDQTYVIITAIFRKDRKGHFSICFGSLTDVENVKIIIK